jgi:peptidoglycan/LPS O-acetylase OafA/YrhL
MNNNFFYKILGSSQAAENSVKISKENNFDFVRLVAAFLVLYSHQFALMKMPEPNFYGHYSFGGVGVLIFFSISGYLVAQSWFADPNVVRFAIKRVLRIWPALVVVVVLTAYVLGAFVTRLPLWEYLSHRATLDYLLNIILTPVYVLPGVFEENPYARGVNGSLWTIPIEVRCYAVLGFLGFLGLLRHRLMLLIFCGAYIVWYGFNGAPDFSGNIKYGRDFSAYFLAGAALYCLRNVWADRRLLFSMVFFLIGCGFWFLGFKYAAVLIALPVLVIAFGLSSTPFFRRFARWGDVSYGVYLYAFPVQQTVIYIFFPHIGFYGAMFMAVLLTTVLAFASWHWIEKRALQLKPVRS